MCFGGDEPKKSTKKSTKTTSTTAAVVAPKQATYNGSLSPARRNRDRGGTLLTGGLGLMGEATTDKKTLLGQ